MGSLEEGNHSGWDPRVYSVYRALPTAWSTKELEVITLYARINSRQNKIQNNVKVKSKTPQKDTQETLFSTSEETRQDALTIKEKVIDELDVIKIKTSLQTIPQENEKANYGPAENIYN